MTTITNTQIDKIVKEAGSRFLHQRTCVANQPNMLELVDRLEEYTDEVADKADEYGMTTDTNVQQWAKDYNNWLLRLSAYRRALDGAVYQSGKESCEELRVPVNEPLLVGWYPPDTPGIINPKLQTVADVATPYMLGNQVLVYREHQQERLERLIKDMLLMDEEARQGVLDYWGEKTGMCGPAGCGGPCDTACWVRRVAIGLGVVGGVYLVYRGTKWAMARHPGKTLLAGAFVPPVDDMPPL